MGPVARQRCPPPTAGFQTTGAGPGSVSPCRQTTLLTTGTHDATAESEADAGTDVAAVTAEYVRLCGEHPQFSKPLFRRAVLTGDRLVQTAGGWLQAVRLVRSKWKEQYGDNLRGVWPD